MGLLLVHAVATVAMAGLIWFVQLVHYPLFSAVGARGFRDYAELHAQRTTWIVAPLMLVELGCTAWITLSLPPHAEVAVVAAGAILLGVIWVSTLALQVPCHRRLAHGFDAATAKRLVQTNWLRTIAWTGRAWVAVQLCVAATG